MIGRDPRVRYALHPQLAHRAVGPEVFLVTDDRAFHRLSSTTAVELFEKLKQGECRRDELVATLTERYEVSPERAAEDVDAFLQSLLERLVIVSLAD